MTIKQVQKLNPHEEMHSKSDNSVSLFSFAL